MNDELLDRYIYCEVIASQFETLIALILDNASLNWNEKGLSINSEAVIPYLKTIAPNDYERRLEALKKENEKND